MKTDFSINVQVNLGVTPELVQLVSAIISHKPIDVQSSEALLTAHAQVEEKPEDETLAQPQPPTKRGRKKKEEPADTKQDNGEAAGNNDNADTNTDTETATKEPGEADANQDKSQVQAEAKEEDKQADAPKELTEEDVRAAMHKTRQRIEGEDYKEHTDSEAYKKYHRALTAQFKNISALLGADKPSALPADKRKSFIEECDYLEVLEDGTIGNKAPF